MKLADKVIDGTRCNENGLDVCVDGTCQVSLDLLLIKFYDKQKATAINAMRLQFDRDVC